MKCFTFVIVFLVGCAATTPPPPPITVPVSGKVYLSNGNIMTGGRIVFKPKDKSHQEAIGEINSDGSFKLTSYNKDDGAMVGEYVVVVDKVSYKTGSPIATKADVPKKYLSETSSDIVILVGDGQENYIIKLK